MNLNQTSTYVRNNKDVPKKFIYYIHNPRTGGKYIKDLTFSDVSFYPNGFSFQWFGKIQALVLGKKYDEHPCAMENPIKFHKTIRNQSQTFIYDSYFLDPRSLVLFTVRNPYDRYVAAYLDAKYTHEKYKKYSFKEFLIEVCDPDFRPNPKYPFSFDISRPFFPYQIFTDCDYPVADIVLRKELLDQGLKEILAYFGMVFNNHDQEKAREKWDKKRLEKGVAKNRDYREFYKDNESIDIVMQCRKKELIAFVYDFEDNHDGTALIDPSNIRYSHEKNKLWFEEDGKGYSLRS